MSRSTLRKLIIGILVILFLIVALVGFLSWEHELCKTRGYGLLGRPDYPYGRARQILYRITELYDKYGREFGGKFPDTITTIANIPELVLPENQPYEEFGVLILKSERINQTFLCFQNSFVSVSKLARMRNKLRTSTAREGEISHVRLANLVIVCVMATERNSSGIYCPYNDYPLILKEEIGLEAWKTWYFIFECNGLALTSYVQSDIPPIPGCLAYTDPMRPELKKFYYPEEILPIVKAIYPRADIPEEQILREGRNY